MRVEDVSFDCCINAKSILDVPIRPFCRGFPGAVSGSLITSLEQR